MRNKVLSFLLVFTVALLSLSPLGFAENELALSAMCAVLMNASTGEVLYSRNMHEKRGIASTTKIMTSLIALEYGEPEREITVPADAVKVEGTSIGLKAGDKITLITLVKGMLLESGNDAANVTAFAVSGGISQFAALMNERAKKLGMLESFFKNPSGLTDEGHYSTAYDMAVLTSFALKNPSFRKICSSKSAKVSYGNPAYERTLTNHNKLLYMYEGAIGVKTGFTKASGRCLVSAAVKDGATLVAVTLNAPDDWNDHIKLFDYGFEKLSEVKSLYDLTKYSVNVVGSDKKTVPLKALIRSENPAYVSAAENKLTVKIFAEHFVYAPIEAGDCIGSAVFFDKNGTKITEIPLVASEAAACAVKIDGKRLTLFERVKNFFKNCFKQTEN